MSNEKTIELDCEPGATRPGHFIAWVVAGTILENLPEADAEATVSRFFGNWMWDFSKVSDENWESAKPIISTRIKELYATGRIRYGSW